MASLKDYSLNLTDDGNPGLTPIARNSDRGEVHKVIIMGASKVGKTCLVVQFVQNSKRNCELILFVK